MDIAQKQKELADALAEAESMLEDLRTRDPERYIELMESFIVHLKKIEGILTPQ